mmetsp:Transcript_5597/g.6045  ORF Transcript_5597/g.6045 Transcript_5597/m.6045 type:complete len:92 (+) Transcript_5597:32-307(+)
MMTHTASVLVDEDFHLDFLASLVHPPSLQVIANRLVDDRDAALLQYLVALRDAVESTPSLRKRVAHGKSLTVLQYLTDVKFGVEVARLWSL